MADVIWTLIHVPKNPVNACVSITNLVRLACIRSHSLVSISIRPSSRNLPTLNSISHKLQQETQERNPEDIFQITMPLLSFPNELLHTIAGGLDIRNLNHLSQTNRRFNELLSPYLTDYIIQRKDVLLPWASHKGHQFLASFLLEKNIDITKKDENGYSALDWATMNVSEPMVRLLLQKGANISSLDGGGKMALSLAAHRGNTPLVGLLVDYGAPIDSRNEIGETALHFSANRGYSETITLLLEKGANISAIDKKGRTPLHCAVMSGYRCEPVVQTLLCNGADITARDCEGRTVLHCAVGGGYGREDVIKLLLEKGADITSRDNNGQTPLHKAAAAGEGPVARILIQFGADIAALDCQGRTVLHTMAYFGYRPTVWKCGGWDGWKTTIKIFLEAGVDMYARDNEGDTAFDAAVKKGCDSMATILKDYAAENCSFEPQIVRVCTFPEHLNVYVWRTYDPNCKRPTE